MRIAEKRLQRIGIHLVAAAIGAVAADELRAGKRQVANGVERLVANELVLGVTQAFDD